MVLPNCKAYFGGYTHNLFALQCIKERLEVKYPDRLIVVVDEFDKVLGLKSFEERQSKSKRKELTLELVKERLRRL
jgi:hypothetical protein